MYLRKQYITFGICKGLKFKIHTVWVKLAYVSCDGTICCLLSDGIMVDYVIITFVFESVAFAAESQEIVTQWVRLGAQWLGFCLSFLNFVEKRWPLTVFGHVMVFACKSDLARRV